MTSPNNLCYTITLVQWMRMPLRAGIFTYYFENMHDKGIAECRNLENFGSSLFLWLLLYL